MAFKIRTSLKCSLITFYEKSLSMVVIERFSWGEGVGGFWVGLNLVLSFFGLMRTPIGSHWKANFYQWRSRNRKRSRKSIYAVWKSNIRVVSRVIRAMESEGSERFLFLPALLMTPSLRSAYDLVKTRLSESEAEAEGNLNHNISSHVLWLL